MVIIIQSVAIAGDYYKWQDENGQWNFTNTPPQAQHAEKMNMRDNEIDSAAIEQNHINQTMSAEHQVVEAKLRKERIWLQGKIDKAREFGSKKWVRKWTERKELFERDPIVYYEMKKNGNAIKHLMQ